jgi:hypothetical protein
MTVSVMGLPLLPNCSFGSTLYEIN